MAARRSRRRSRQTLAALPSLELATPGAIRLSNRTAMLARWIDPDDLAPNRRSAKEVHGWRSFCPLRRLVERANGASGITMEHVTAADLLRREWDIASIGLSGRKTPWMFTDALHLPRSGPSRAAVRQVRAIRNVQRVMRLFVDAQRDLIEWIILRNQPVLRWRTARGIAQRAAMPMLVGVLDELVRHFDDEIRRFGVAA
jgi:hypothetical protein